MYIKSAIKRPNPSSTPLFTLNEAKDHLRVLHSDEDDYIAGIIPAVKSWVEEYTGLILFTETISEVYDRFPALTTDSLLLSAGPVTAVTGITYRTIAATGTQVTFSDFFYKDINPPQVITTNQWPGDTVAEVRVTYTVGYGSTPAAIPAPIRRAALLMLADLYDNRTDGVRTLPTAADSLLNFYRITRKV